MRRYGGILAAAILLTAWPSYAQAPSLINYQGYLTDDSGKPISGAQSLTFGIYAAAAGGMPLWSEMQVVVVDDGLMNVLLGAVTPLDPESFAKGERYLGVRIGAGEEMLPRQRLVSVGYAFESYNAARLNGRLPSAYVRSVDGVDPSASGNISLIEGDNIEIESDGAAHSLTISSTATLALPFTSTIDSDTTALTVRNTGDGWGIFGSSTTTTGIRGQSSASSGIGVTGLANGANARGVYGQSAGANGTGVLGFASAYRGVHGTSTSGVGVFGENTERGNFGRLGDPLTGVYGENGDSGNTGSLGGRSEGVYGEGDSDPGVVGQSTTGHGVWGLSVEGQGVRGQSEDDYGVYGQGERAGVYGFGRPGPGLHGFSEGGTAVLAQGDLDVRGAYRGRIASNSASDGAPFPRPAFDSGWFTVGQGQTVTIPHGIGGDADDYVVDMRFRDASLGVHIRGYGADGRSLTSADGAYWRNLTNDEIRVTRFNNDDVVDAVRLRIWVIR